ncbi:ABC transporter ATP-binding protein [Candidatus Albibeggiatoa sp. nov. NOAA]|uniref:ABC transporter ATP-binding protein n=1 Tax=Candidatus Albibeggiatoa sp. nov. NOAA TaxID=3162724 RepID=UPI0032FE0C8F|nr:ABC transporter ATP-binding protein [Thiotrichaceae bacterium]
MAAIRIQQVHKHYKQLHALKGVDFEIPEGSFFGLLGPNGAGKSTLINIMAGLVKATSGSISIKGHDVRKQWRQARQSLGVVPQELVYDPFFTVKELLRLQSGYFGFGRENEVWLDELLEILSLSDKANTNMFELSGGMKRRVLIGQALVHKPPVVVLDEPTAGVDIELRKMLWDFATQLHDKGHTIVLTTHYLEEAESLCDRIAILNHGEVVALDNKQALLGRYPFRLLCLSLENHADIPTSLQDKVQSFENNQLVLRLHREHDTVSDVLESLRSAQINFVDLHTQEPGLEEVFMSLTNKEATA